MIDQRRGILLVLVASVGGILACTNTPPASSAQSATSASTLATGGAVRDWEPDVQVGTITLTAHNTDGERVVGRLVPQFRRCYLEALAATPTMKGELTLTVRIGAGGEVESAVARDIRGVTPEVAACMTTVARNASFAAPSAAGATLFVPLSCIPRSARAKAP